MNKKIIFFSVFIVLMLVTTIGLSSAEQSYNCADSTSPSACSLVGGGCCTWSDSVGCYDECAATSCGSGDQCPYCHTATGCEWEGCDWDYSGFKGCFNNLDEHNCYLDHDFDGYAVENDTFVLRSSDPNSCQVDCSAAPNPHSCSNLPSQLCELTGSPVCDGPSTNCLAIDTSNCDGSGTGDYYPICDISSGHQGPYCVGSITCEDVTNPQDCSSFGCNTDLACTGTVDCSSYTTYGGQCSADKPPDCYSDGAGCVAIGGGSSFDCGIYTNIPTTCDAVTECTMAPACVATTPQPLCFPLVSNATRCNDAPGCTYQPDQSYSRCDGSGFCSQISNNFGSTSTAHSACDGIPSCTWYDGSVCSTISNTGNYLSENVLQQEEWDCNDSDESIHPGAAEVCNNGLDDNCNGLVDCNDSECASNPICCACDTPSTCEPPGNTGLVCDGCNYIAGSSEVCNNGLDDDCNGLIDDDCCACDTPNTCQSGDTGLVCDGCNWVNVSGNDERCNNGLDDNCNGKIDCADATCIGPPCQDICLQDMDSDTYGVVPPDPVFASPCPANTTSYTSDPSGPLDCDDTTANVHPGLTENCNDGIDNDCDGTIDCYDSDCFDEDSCPGLDCFKDDDTDSYANPSVSYIILNPPSPVNATICDVECGSLNTESDCTAIDGCTWHGGSGAGNGNQQKGVEPTTINVPVGRITSFGESQQCNNNGICESGETCSSCSVDCNCNCTGGHQDFIPENYLLRDGTNNVLWDCNDQNASINPGRSEPPIGFFGVDDDCDGLIDEVDVSCFRDADWDNYGNETNNYTKEMELATLINNSYNCYVPCTGLSSADCNQLSPECSWSGSECQGTSARYVFSPHMSSPPFDCNDYSFFSNPGRSEPPPGIIGLDDDCDGYVDEVALNCYQDNDRDGFPNESSFTTIESPPQGCPVGYISENDLPHYPPGNPQVGQVIWDCDDTNPILTYLCCSGSFHFSYVKTAYNGSHFGTNTIEANDYPKYLAPPFPNSNPIYQDIYRGACCLGADSCVDPTAESFVNNFDSGLCEIPGTTVSSSGDDSTFVCGSPSTFGSLNEYSTNGAWMDVDSDKGLCEGISKLWAPAGISTYINGITMLPNEYEATTVAECCGDDVGESIPTQYCNGTRVSITSPVCCPSGYYLLNNSCVSPELCPDIQRDAPVWMTGEGVNASTLIAWDTYLENSGEGYCCSGSPGHQGPLCGTEVGCFIHLQEKPVRNALEGLPPWKDHPLCGKTYSDDACVIDVCDGDYEACEQSDVVHEQTLSLGTITGSDYAAEKLCNYPINYNPVSCHPILPQNCDRADVTGECEEVNITVCTPGTDCTSFCQFNDAGEVVNCREVCKDYTCKNISTYRGPDCRYKQGCAPDATVCSQLPIISYNSGSLPTCSDVTTADESSYEFKLSRIDNDQLFCYNHSCSSESVGVHELECAFSQTQEGLPLVVRNKADGSLIQCATDTTQWQGDPWCPPGYSYGTDVNYCERDHAMCDSAINGQTDKGCDDLLNPGDDSIWSMYDNDCVSQSGSLPEGLSHVYDRGCCKSYAVGSLEVYEWNDIKVY